MSRRLALAGLTLAALAALGVGGGAAHGAAPGPDVQARTAEPAVSLSSVLTSPAGDLPSGPRANGTAVLPDGRFVTPVGRSVAVDLEPQHETLSRDARRLYVSDEGVDSQYLTDPRGVGHNARYFSVIDTATMAVTRVEDDALSSGIAESADGLTVYVAEGQTDAIGVFRRTPAPRGAAGDTGVGTFAKVADYVIKAGGKDYPSGLALSPDGSRVYVSGFSADTLTAVSVAGPTAGAVLAQVPTGSYPYDVVLSADGTKAFVTNWGLYNGDAALGVSSPIAPPPASYGGYNTTNSSSVWSYDLTGATPKVATATRIGDDLDGSAVDGDSSPSGMALSPDGRTLAVTSSNDDQVELLDLTQTVASTATPSTNAIGVPRYPAAEVDLRVLVGTAAVAAPTGAQPNAVAWSPDGKVLFVGEGERDDVAVIDPSRVAPETTLGTVATTVGTAAGDGPGTAAGPNRTAVTGRIPTAWYPSSLAVSPDSGHLYVTTMKGLGSGPNDTLSQAGSYIPDTIRGRVSDVELSAACAALPALTADSDRDNGLVPAGTQFPQAPVAQAGGDAGDGYVVPTAFGQPASAKVKHVFLIIKENRPYDQVFGDLPTTESSGRNVAYGNYITPNSHAIASSFALSDNYYATTETSTQGHYAIDTGQVNEFTDKVTPTSYAGKYPYGPFDTTPENVPEGGFIWNNAARHGVRSTIFGEATVVVGIGPAALASGTGTTSAGQLAPGVAQNALTTFDPLYPTQVNLQGNFNAAPGNPVKTLYPYNDEGRASAFADDLAAAAGTKPPVNGEASAATIGALNVMILFDDHTDGDIVGAQTPERRVAENDHALGEVLSTISHSTYWPDSAVFVTEDDTQGGVDHVDAYRSFGLVASPWAKRGQVSHVHTSFSSIQKTIDLILGLPPTSLQELTATSMADMFVGGGAGDATPYTTLANNTQPDANLPLSAAPNERLRQAARLATLIPPGIDRGGAILPLDDWLERQGELEAGDPNVQPAVDAVHHTLPTGSPDPVTLGPPVPTGGHPAADGCLAMAAATPALGETRTPIELVGAALLATLAVASARRRRRATAAG